MKIKFRKVQDRWVAFNSSRIEADTEEWKRKNVCRSHWRLIAWKFELILMNNRNTELIRKTLLIKLYHCFDHAKEFDDLKTKFNTEIWFRSECRLIRFNDVSRALKFWQITVYIIFSKLR